MFQFTTTTRDLLLIITFQNEFTPAGKFSPVSLALKNPQNTFALGLEPKAN